MAYLKSFTLVAAATLAGAVAAPATASTVIAGACVSVADPAGCKFDGNINGNSDPTNVNSYLNAQNAYNLYNDSVLTAAPDITLHFLGDTTDGFPGTFTGAGTTSGTWTLTGYLVDFVAVKAGDEFVLYKLMTPTDSAPWSTAGLVNKQGKLKDLSHIAFFGVRDPGPGPVPEPATWAMMIAGFGIAGMSLRRRKVRAAFA